MWEGLYSARRGALDLRGAYRGRHRRVLVRHADDPPFQMSREMAQKWWRRPHANGMEAIVVRNDDDDPYSYSVGALPMDDIGNLGRSRGSLEHAQAAADTMANCRGCRCPPWPP